MGAAVKFRRNRQLAMIHCGKKYLGLDDETYRQMLWTVARVHSAADLDLHGREKVINHMLARGAVFSKPGRRKYKRGTQAAKIAQLWASLARAGKVRSNSDRAIRAWVKRQTNGKYDAPDLCDVETASELIEQLKQWLARGRARG